MYMYVCDCVCTPTCVWLAGHALQHLPSRCTFKFNFESLAGHASHAQSAIVNARPRDADTDDKRRGLLRYLRVESFLVLLLALVVNTFVICVFAEGFYGSHNAEEVRVCA